MLDDENAARHALLTLNDEPAPPPVTTLDHVVRRGRRRVLVQRVSTIAAVVAVVAGIGVGTVLLRSGGHNSGVQVGSTTEPSANPALPGWQQVDLPRTGTASDASCTQDPAQKNRLAPPATSVLPSTETMQEALIGVTRSAAVPMQDPGYSVLVSAMKVIPEAPSVSGVLVETRGVSVGIPTGTSVGLLLLDASPYGGTPEQAADASVVEYGDCEPPYRRVLADGTVLQLYPVRVDPQQPTRAMHIYGAGGVIYRLILVGTVDVPVTEEQFRTIGEQLVSKLG